MFPGIGRILLMKWYRYTCTLQLYYIVFFLNKPNYYFFLVQYICILMLPDCSRECHIKKNSWGSMPPNPPSKLTAAPLDRQISVFIGKAQSHAWLFFSVATPFLYSSSLKGDTMEVPASVSGITGRFGLEGMLPMPLTRSWCATWFALTKHWKAFWLWECDAWRLLWVMFVDVMTSSHLLFFSSIMLSSNLSSNLGPQIPWFHRRKDCTNIVLLVYASYFFYYIIIKIRHEALAAYSQNTMK